METWHFVAYGRVQGVGYRAGCVEAGTALGLTGWVRNRQDGTVEVVAQGPAERLERLRGWMWRGPVGAEVLRVDVGEGVLEGSGEGFVWRGTV